MLIIPVSFPIAYAKLVGKARGVSLLLTILIAFGILLAIAFSQVSGPTGLETRFGSFGSEFFNTVSISTNTGSANSALSGMSPNPVISFLLGMFIQSVPGADGTGIMYMIIYVILTLFIVGLMVGKTPEFMNMKISPRDVKISSIYLLNTSCINFNSNCYCFYYWECSERFSCSCRKDDNSLRLYSSIIRVHISISKQWL